MENNNQTQQGQEDAEMFSVTEDRTQESTIATNQRDFLASADDLPLNEILTLTSEEIKSMSADELKAKGVQLQSRTLTRSDERHLYRVSYKPDEKTGFTFKCYFGRPSSNPNEQLFVNTFSVNQNGVLVDSTWSGSEVIGSSVAHGTSGFSDRDFTPQDLTKDRYFSIGLYDNSTLPNAPYIFFVAKI